MKTTRIAWLSTLFIFGLSLYSGAQSPDSDYLARYSYPIFALEGKRQYTGTAFLYRAGDSIFLVSNYHAIKGMSPLRQAITFTADTLYFKYPLKDVDGFNLMAIDISEASIGATEVFSMVDRIDLLKIPIALPVDADVQYINDLIDPTYMDETPEEVLVFGFPPGKGSIPAFYSRQQRLHGSVNEKGFIEYDASLRRSNPGTSERARKVISETARYYYFIRPYAAQGYSGAPVFGKFRNADNEIVYRFTGVVFAGQPNTRQTWAIKGAVALQYLQGEL
jgi:hypothetical protein